eukprot:jgi/Picsp_1/5709/NSC_03068-R1_---NA---
MKMLTSITSKYCDWLGELSCDTRERENIQFSSRVKKCILLPIAALLVSIGSNSAQSTDKTTLLQDQDQEYVGVDSLATCLKNLQDARAALVEGGGQGLVDTVEQQYARSTLPGDHHAFCFETPEDPENWRVREAVVHPFIETGVPDGERPEELSEAEISNPTWGYASEVARLAELSRTNQDGPLFLYYFHIDQDSLASSGKSVPSGGTRREYTGFSNTGNGTNGTELLLDCGCPLNLVSINQRTEAPVASSGSVQACT